MSYYLNRWHRRADPVLTAEIDWRRAIRASELDSILDARNIGYLIFDDRDWSDREGGIEMAATVRGAVASRLLDVVHTSREPLFGSRVLRHSDSSDVYVMRRTLGLGKPEP